MKKTILVVDRDTSISDWLRTLFEKDYDIHVVQSLDGAVGLLSHRQFDLIITEAFNQNHTFDFDPCYLSRLRSPVANIPVIWFSIYASPTMISWADFGLAGILSKPTELTDIVEEVERALGESRYQGLPLPAINSYQ